MDTFSFSTCVVTCFALILLIVVASPHLPEPINLVSQMMDQADFLASSPQPIQSILRCFLTAPGLLIDISAAARLSLGGRLIWLRWAVCRAPTWVLSNQYRFTTNV
ncbi:hypothetical protein QBC44DRAFT_332160 [Cladorrhinum sp. PSN332]|nr:hypothetical protein QBC44DRAFT_332160 [Cladorrhinum sp. PSN332]